jgi:flavin-dependent dehydrogenase
MYKRKPYGPGWALTGDAGYHMDPLAARGTTGAVLGAELIARAICETLGGERPAGEAFAEFHAARDEQLTGAWEMSYTAIMRMAPTERDVREAHLFMARPELVAQHIEVMRGLRDAEAFRRTVDEALAETAAAG